jgi:hypothetical protein
VVSNEMNHDLEEEVSEAEVLVALNYMKNGKIPRLDDLIIEFFISFNEMVKEEFLKVVRESQGKGRWWVH